AAVGSSKLPAGGQSGSAGAWGGSSAGRASGAGAAPLSRGGGVGAGGGAAALVDGRWDGAGGGRRGRSWEPRFHWGGAGQVRVALSGSGWVGILVAPGGPGLAEVLGFGGGSGQVWVVRVLALCLCQFEPARRDLRDLVRLSGAYHRSSAMAPNRSRPPSSVLDRPGLRRHRLLDDRRRLPRPGPRAVHRPRLSGHGPGPFHRPRLRGYRPGAFHRPRRIGNGFRL